ncbi:TPA: hypothetical protein I9640_003898 [Clostridioides difficile]|nr:hypothetical protein [Clostridioides difficile]
MLSLFWGFRLTKWNVNLSRKHIISNIKNSFRLTKWNVNNAEKFESWVFDEGFRLTKWNVNTPKLKFIKL